MADEIPEDAAYWEFTFNGVVHRVPVTPKQARDWLEGERALANLGRGELFVDEDGQLMEDHGWPEDPDAESPNPEVFGVPLGPEDPDTFALGDNENPDDDEP